MGVRVPSPAPVPVTAVCGVTREIPDDLGESFEDADCRDVERGPQARLHVDHHGQGYRFQGRCRG
ncbi:hypothetical protein SPHINGOAX6_70544 [Sphingomonas sp. AX6]|nr:hypothetical protein SPHINGOAX6_70544 [Sphingomonas sp. AX6]